MNPADATIDRIECREQTLIVAWRDGSVSEYPYIWLRDNDVAELHPTTHERTFDLTTVDIDLQPDTPVVADNAVRLRWPDRSDHSSYTSDWLFRHRPGHMRCDPAGVEQRLWNAESLPAIPRFSATDCAADAATLADALLTVKSMGLVVFDGLDDDPAAGEAFGERIGFKRETNFGVMFDVVSKPDPNNLAYTADALPLHIDLTNQELVPGFQFLHCVVNDAEGGESIFADGYRICADLQERAPEFFATLKRIAIPCRFYDKSCDIRQRRPVISQADNGDFTQLVFNAHIADVPDMPVADLLEFYPAYQALMKLARAKTYSIQHVLLPGEMAMFDNRRIMHGRGAFDPSTGHRHLRGFYIDRNEVDSRIRVLRRP